MMDTIVGLRAAARLSGAGVTKRAVTGFAAAVLLLLSAPLAAQERILSYDTEIAVRADGSLDVAENITVRAEGSSIRRGIYRDFPTKYRDRFGNRVRVDLEVLGVERNGEPEAWFTERQSNGVRINTGGDDYLPSLPGEYTFTIRYRTTRQLGFFESHDELYWNAIGTGWDFPVESGSVVVRLPEPVAVEQLSAEGYTGPQGAQGAAYTASMPAPGTARYALTQRLEAREGFTVVLTFPKGLIAEPTIADRVGWFLRDNAGVLVALAGLLALLLYSVLKWRRVGRDPRPGVIIPRYEPPAQQTPASLRYLRRMGYDMRCFSADLLALAVAGHVRIHQTGRRGKEWRLERTDPATARADRAIPLPGAGDPHGTAAMRAVAAEGAAVEGAAAAERAAAAEPAADPDDVALRVPVSGATAPLQPTQRPLLDKLFPTGRRELKLTNKEAATVSGAQQAHTKALDHVLHPRYFQRNTSAVWLGVAIIVVTGIAAFSVSGGAGIPAIIAVLLVMWLALALFARLVRAPTEQGRRLLDEIEGLKLYLGVAERDDLARLQSPAAPPQLDADRYEALLPYAVALEVEDAWTKKFTIAVGAAAVAAATQRMGWYAGSGRAADLGSFTRAIGSSLTSSIASASTPPGSSSGSGGGGSSGGGGGGGGGGGR
jgi:hypothetical protein